MTNLEWRAGIEKTRSDVRARRSVFVDAGVLGGGEVSLDEGNDVFLFEGQVVVEQGEKFFDELGHRVACFGGRGFAPGLHCLVETQVALDGADQTRR